MIYFVFPLCFQAKFQIFFSLNCLDVFPFVCFWVGFCFVVVVVDVVKKSNIVGKS